MNLATVPRETLYQLQDGVTVGLRAREGHTLQVLMEHKENLEQVRLQRDDLVAHNKELEPVMVEVYSSVLELVVPAELPIDENIHHMVAGFHKA